MILSSGAKRRAPGPGLLPFFLNLGKLRGDPLTGFFQAALQYGPVVRYRGLWVTHQITTPSSIQQVLQRNSSNYLKGRGYKILEPALGKGLLTSDGAVWQRQRKMSQPAFSAQRVASFVPIMQRHADLMLRRWERLALSGRTFDAVPEFMHLTLNIASESLFSTNLEADTQVIREALHVGRDYSVNRAWSILNLPLSVPTRRNREYRKALYHFHGVIEHIIAERRLCKRSSGDLLDTLMDARDEHGDPMSDRQLRDEVATLLTAGHETTTLALAWACYIIAARPNIAERLQSELQFLNGAAPTYDELPRLKYLRMVIEETMRLYPPVWSFSRTASCDDEIEQFDVPSGSEILIFPFITHRWAKWWSEPEEFCPERFAPENSASRPRHAYLPFGTGPRICIGLNFAMAELQLVLAMILQRFCLLLPADAQHIRPDPSVTLRPYPGVWLQVNRIPSSG